MIFGYASSNKVGLKNHCIMMNSEDNFRRFPQAVWTLESFIFQISLSTDHFKSFLLNFQIPNYYSVHFPATLTSKASTQTKALHLWKPHFQNMILLTRFWFQSFKQKVIVKFDNFSDLQKILSSKFQSEMIENLFSVTIISKTSKQVRALHLWKSLNNLLSKGSFQ